jgi:O-antigen/teichoic acid export membrane protein
MERLITFIQHFFTSGHERTRKVKKNVAVSFFLKGASILVSLLSVPLAIRYVNTMQYGVWLTLSAMFTWFTLFDIGFGNGLRNKLTEALAKGDEKLARAYVSTTYVAVVVIGVVLFAIFLFINLFVDWTRILNVPSGMKSELNLVVFIAFMIFAVQFVLQLVNIVSQARQNTITPSLITLTGNVAGLILVYVLTRTTHGSLLYLCLSIGLTPVCSLGIYSILLFTGPYEKLAPSFRLADRKYVREIMNLGVKFFIIQVGLIFYYNCDNLIITQVLGPAAVTPYNLAFKYFGVITVISAILMTPFWAAFVDAGTRQDYAWIKNSVRQLEKISVGVFALSLVMLIVSPYVYRLWLGTAVTIPFSLSALFAFFTSLNVYRTIFNYFLNGMGKVMLQLYLVVVAGIVNIPLAIFLCRVYGVMGVLMSTTLLCIFSAIFEIMQYKKLINHTATGIWNK